MIEKQYHVLKPTRDRLLPSGQPYKHKLVGFPTLFVLLLAASLATSCVAPAAPPAAEATAIPGSQTAF